VQVLTQSTHTSPAWVCLHGQLLQKLYRAFVMLSHEAMLTPCSVVSTEQDGASAGTVETTLVALLASVIQHLICTHLHAFLGLEKIATDMADGVCEFRKASEDHSSGADATHGQLMLHIQAIVVDVLTPAFFKIQSLASQSLVADSDCAMLPQNTHVTCDHVELDAGCVMAAIGSYMSVVLSASHQQLLATAESEAQRLTTCGGVQQRSPSSKAVSVTAVHPCAATGADTAVRIISQGSLPYIIGFAPHSACCCCLAMRCMY
jgi:hypothetical protein